MVCCSLLTVCMCVCACVYVCVRVSVRVCVHLQWTLNSVKDAAQYPRSELHRKGLSRSQHWVTHTHPS